MEYRRFGPTDMTVSAPGFGFWEMGGTYGDVIAINCFDTAPAYGEGASEVVLGKGSVAVART